jgi:hypothetical protein
MHGVHNERVRALATALSNLGVGAILAGVVVPTVGGSFGSAANVAAWLVLGVDLIALAYAWLGRLQ